MSADNGIYILKSPVENGKGFEFRVIEAQAIENIMDSYGVNSEHLIKYFGEAEVLDEQQAHEKAFQMEHEIYQSEIPILEYGIRTITIDRSLEWYKRHDYYDV